MRDFAKIVVSDRDGKIYHIPHIQAVGMRGHQVDPLLTGDLIKMPHASELFMLPGRSPIGYDPNRRRFLVLDNLVAVSAFISPGYTICHNSAYNEVGRPKRLPLFSYGALAYYKGDYYVSAARVDSEKRQDLRLMRLGDIKRGVKKLRKIFPDNRLIRHLEGCALCYGCPAAKNFFLSRYEAPLPTSPACNARCIGCISYQPKGGPSVTQPRIKFSPSAQEISQAALYHIKNVRDPVVSFGQGCEGEPLLRGVPALLTRMSNRPKLSRAVLMMLSPPSIVATESWLATAVQPLSLISATTCSAGPSS